MNWARAAQQTLFAPVTVFGVLLFGDEDLECRRKARREPVIAIGNDLKAI